MPISSFCLLSYVQAAEIGYISVCKMLVQHRADLTLEDHQNETALAKAKKRAHSDIAAFLVSSIETKKKEKKIHSHANYTIEHLG